VELGAHSLILLDLLIDKLEKGSKITHRKVKKEVPRRGERRIVGIMELAMD